MTSAVGCELSTTVKVAVPPGFGRGQAGRRRDGDARGVVVGVGDGDVAGVEPVVVAVTARRRRRDDGVADVAVVEFVVDAGDGDGLRDVPVGGREGDARRADRAFGRVARAQRRWSRRPVGCELSTTANVAVPPASVVVRPAVGLTMMPDRVVVDVGDRDVGRIDPVVDRVGAGRQRGQDGVDDVAVGYGIVDAGDGDGLRRVPVRGGEGQAGRADGAFRRVVRTQANRHVRGRLRIQDHRERRRAAAFRREQARRRIDRDAGRVVVDARDRDVARVLPVVTADARWRGRYRSSS